MPKVAMTQALGKICVLACLCLLARVGPCIASQADVFEWKRMMAVATWYWPTDPVHIVGSIYYVGTKGLAAYLIATSGGHILLDGGMPGSGPVIAASIRKLGFDPKEIRILLITHAHIDHVGTLAYFKDLSGAEVVVMEGDEEHVRQGGSTDPVYGRYFFLRFPGVTVDRVIKDYDQITLGNITMTARLGAGHTEGATTWTTTVTYDAKSYTVVFPCCTYVSPSTRALRCRPSGDVAVVYRRTFKMLESLAADIWLPAHTEAFPFEEMRKRAINAGATAWIDPTGYRDFLSAEMATFERKMGNETPC